MKVIEYESKIYHLKLSIGDYIAIQQLGLVERLSTYPSMVDYLTLCSILMGRYNFDEEELYDFIDYITEEYEINDFLEELLIDSGIIEKSQYNQLEKEEQPQQSNDTVEEKEMTFEEQLDDMLQDCLGFGLSVDMFYSMTFKEVKLFIQGIQKHTEREQQDKAMFDYLLANLITIGTGVVLGGKTSFPTYEEYYGKVFGETSADDDLELEGYVTDDLGQQTAIYKHKFDANKDMARMELLAIAQQQKLNSLQKELEQVKKETDKVECEGE